MTKMQKLCIVSLSLFALCAKKALPPSPDRFPPHLSKIKCTDRIHISLHFSEKIDTVQTDNFLIISETFDTLKIKSVLAEPQGNTVTLITETQKPIPYYLRAVVEDIHGNKAKLNRRFKGNPLPDTIPPRIVSISPSKGKTGMGKLIRITISFSEPLDTTSMLRYAIFPKRFKEEFTTAWSRNLANLQFSLIKEDTTEKTPFYFLLGNSLTDFDRNSLTSAGFTSFTQDSIIPEATLTGRIEFQKRPKNDVFLFFYSLIDQEAVAATVSDESGKFSLRLRPHQYRMIAVVDTTGDGIIDLYAKRQILSFEQEELLINLSQPREILYLDDFFN